MIDADNEFKHKVYGPSLRSFRNGFMQKVQAECGKIWAPTEFGSLITKPDCPVCFPPRAQYAIAA